PNGGEMARRTAQHPLSLAAHCRHRARTIADLVLPYRHHRRLVQHDALSTHIDQRIGGAQIDRNVVGEDPAKLFEHESGTDRQISLSV
ncbi:hypothetical protein RF55_26109, partial [Lasius niger]